jgi:hypothetical protein
MDLMETKQAKKPNVRKIITVVLLLAACVAVIYFVYGNAIYGEMNALKLIPSPEAFTELYFTDPSALPASAPSDQPLVFDFTISNIEGVQMNYPYVVSFMDAAGKEADLATGTIAIANGKAVIMHFSERLPVADTQGEIVVTLPSLNKQEIHFSISNHS